MDFNNDAMFMLNSTLTYAEKNPDITSLVIVYVLLSYIITWRFAKNTGSPFPEFIVALFGIFIIPAIAIVAILDVVILCLYSFMPDILKLQIISFRIKSGFFGTRLQQEVHIYIKNYSFRNYKSNACFKAEDKDISIVRVGKKLHIKVDGKTITKLELKRKDILLFGSNYHCYVKMNNIYKFIAESIAMELEEERKAAQTGAALNFFIDLTVFFKIITYK